MGEVGGAARRGRRALPTVQDEVLSGPGEVEGDVRGVPGRGADEALDGEDEEEEEGDEEQRGSCAWSLRMAPSG